MKENKFSLKEWIGDFTGDSTFQGTRNYGVGNGKQLASWEFNPATKAIKQQEDEEHNENVEDLQWMHNKFKLSSLKSEGKQKNRKQLKLSSLLERELGDQFYRDLPGFPRMNTLYKQEDHVPFDDELARLGKEKEDQDNKRIPLIPGFDQEERYNPIEIDHPIGYVDFEHEPDLGIDKANTKQTNAGIEKDFEDNKGESGINTGFDNVEYSQGIESPETLQKTYTYDKNWKDTTPENRGRKIEAVNNALVKPVDWLEDVTNDGNYRNPMTPYNDDEDEMHYLSMNNMGNIVIARNHIPLDTDEIMRQKAYKLNPWSRK